MEVDLRAIARNVEIYRECTDIPLMAVVKSDGYGHGAVEVARTALGAGATWLGVSFLAEASALRAAGIEAPILSFLLAPGEDVAAALAAEIDLPVASLADLGAIATSAQRLGLCAEVHLSVDTGLHRDGAALSAWPALVEKAAWFERCGLVHVRGIFSALAFVYEPAHPATERQLDVFDEALRVAAQAGLTGRMAHVAGTSAGLMNPRSRYDLIRVGGALYGIEAVRGRSYGLVPAMTLRSRVIATGRVEAGEGEFHGHAYRLPGTGDLGLIAVGFADGLPQAASARAQLWIAGERRPVAGTIAMSSCVADAGSAGLAVGEQVLVFGPGDRGEPTIADWAAWAGTNENEIMTNVGPRLPRRYIPAETRDSERSPAETRERGPRRPRVVVLFGGPSGEYEVSVASGATIIGRLDRDRYSVRPVRISPEGRWIPGPVDWPRGPCDPAGLAAATPDPAERAGTDHEVALAVLAGADVVVPALHGSFGEDGAVQGLMDAVGACYVGSGVAASVLGMDKDLAKRVLSASGLRVADWVLLRGADQELSDAERKRLGLPVFVKPARSGSSLGVSPVRGWERLPAALATARAQDRKVLVEQAVTGRELDVAVLEYPDGRVVASAPAEIVLTAGRREFLDYTAKYEDDQAARVLLPAPLDSELTAELRRLAVEAFVILGCRGLARVDFLLRDGVEPVFNEINTFPGFSPTSLYTRMWADAGVELSEILDALIGTALARKTGMR
ncbi:alanine racemase [Actinospica sp.]|uniref:alanine racemase n=1 Tax=Actinospica sp. TaxID=1872142 RepID=UPI002CF583DC|nr:alanine racemase [Actinospica sp.]HWG26048.1 alanine racemase [Actinospica sp.]